jgi:ribosome-associated heat shock protein Hsp15
MLDKLRVDKWLWSARFFKTRSLAADEIGKGRITVNGDVVRASREVKAGDLLVIRQGAIARTVEVRAVSAVRGPAPVAQLLYQETSESLAARAKAAEQRRLAPEPAHSIEGGRPSKRDRRELAKGWNNRWSASLDDD